MLLYSICLSIWRNPLLDFWSIDSHTQRSQKSYFLFSQHGKDERWSLKEGVNASKTAMFRSGLWLSVSFFIRPVASRRKNNIGTDSIELWTPKIFRIIAFTCSKIVTLLCFLDKVEKNNFLSKIQKLVELETVYIQSCVFSTVAKHRKSKDFLQRLPWEKLLNHALFDICC